MADTIKFTILGSVVNTATQKGIGGLRVEAWDLDEKYHDLLGVERTGPDGGFQIDFDSTYFREYAPETQPDIFFKVFRGKRLLRSTESEVIRNASTRTETTIPVNMGTPAVTKPDRVKAATTMKGIRFAKQSDFKGVWNETEAKGSSLGAIAADMVKNSVAKLDFKPMRQADIKTADVVNQAVPTATANLRANDITVTETKTYAPELNGSTLVNVRDFPLRTKPGDKVTLYEKEGRVMYYAIDREKKAELPTGEVSAEMAALETRKAALEKSVTDLKQEVDALTQARAALQDTASLRKELTEMTKMHRELSLSIAKDRPVKGVAEVSEAMDGQLKEVGIRTVGELAEADPAMLVSAGISDVEARVVIEAAGKRLDR